MEKKEVEVEKTDSGDAPANGTVSNESPTVLRTSWPFVLAALIMQVSLPPASPFPLAAHHNVLCLGCEMAQMLLTTLWLFLLWVFRTERGSFSLGSAILVI